ncbi:Queuine tRNA-ribosyltransferase accessory subunit 2 [Aphelenchoides besseyi]|nr:Queuine tRNA-ribosyltransferase accessory subunit 2 [Aphelenchoides besseyi]KAI6199826.1 Queuine tRNA-ribosyltransferase accessory subunit 2 [Aphelenchoides besseyi]
MKFTVDKRFKFARLGRITNYGVPSERDDSIQCILDHQTPSFLLYTKAGHVPHLTWDVFEKHVKLSQRPIFQIPVPSIFNALEVIELTQKSLCHFYRMPSDSLTHLTMNDPLNIRTPGFNTNKTVAIWSKGGKKSIDPPALKSIITASQCHTVGSLIDYDTTKESHNKRLSKALKRTIEFADQTFATEPTLYCSAFLSIGGGASAWHREEMAKQLSKKEYAAGFSIELLNYSHGPLITPKYPFDGEEIGELLQSALEALPTNKLRLVEGSFDPANIFQMVLFGIDLFDSSWAVQLAEESKAFRVSSAYPKTNEFEVLELSNEKYFEDFGPLFDDCSCHTCKNYTKAYLNHLHVTHEMLEQILLVIHNLNEFERMFVAIRKFIDSSS